MNQVQITNISQDDFDDGIQTLRVVLGDGTAIVQQFEWGNVIYRDKTQLNGSELHEHWCTLHDLARLTDSWDMLYTYTKSVAKLVSGPELKKN